MIHFKNLVAIKDINHYKKGEIIYTPLQRGVAKLYFVLSGQVAAIQSPSTPPIFTKSEGDYFGEDYFLLNQTPNHTVLSLSESIIASVDKESFDHFCKNNASIVFELMADLHTKNYVPISNTNIFRTESINAIFPAKHKDYDVPYPDTHDQYLIPVEMTCPHCHSKITGTEQRFSLLRQKNQLGCDLHREYFNFTPEWHDVLTCPNCLFSGLISHWNAHTRVRDELPSQLTTLKNDFTLDFSKIESINTVFASYYLAILCSAAYKDNEQILAKLWRNLSYLYQQVEDETMYHHATEKAYYYYKEFYTNIETTPNNTQTLCMINGSLAKELGLLEEAYQFLYEAKKIKDGKAAYIQLIEREIYEIRELRKQQ